MEQLQIGDKAYYDSLRGLIACKVIDIRGTDGMASTAQTVTLKVTGKHRLYSRGEFIETSGLHAVPRKAVHIRDGSFRIRAYSVKAQYTA